MDNWPGGGHLTQCQSIHWPKKPHFLEMWGQKDELTEDSVDVQPQVCNLPWFLAWTTNQWPVLWSYSQIIASIVVADKGFAQIFQGHTSMALHLTPALQASCLPLPDCPEIRYITRPHGHYTHTVIHSLFPSFKWTITNKNNLLLICTIRNDILNWIQEITANYLRLGK